jgi:hypothetical protein
VGEVLSGAPAWDRAQRRLELAKDGWFARGKRMSHASTKSPAGAACATFDLRDTDERARAEVAKQETDRRLRSVHGPARYSLIRVTSTWEMK